MDYTIYYYYDSTGIRGMEYNGVPYTFLKNLQGDVVYIVNGNGQIVTEYKYSPYGEVMSITGTLASTVGQANPFRYRGYYLDSETGYYYLNTRYYDPVVGRFLNADGYVNANGGFTGYNMFAYCNNNPIMYVDYNGELAVWFVFGIVGAVTNLASTIATDILYNGSFSGWETYVGTVAGGFVGGVVASVSNSHVGAFVRSSASTVITQSLQEATGRTDRDASDIMTNAVVNGAYSTASSYIPIQTSYGDSYKNSSKTTWTDLANGSANGAINGGTKGPIVATVKDNTKDFVVGIAKFIINTQREVVEYVTPCAYFTFQFASCDCGTTNGIHAGQG